jgi:hypothetical protein
MPQYRLDICLAPSGRLGYRREIRADDDAEALRCADEIYNGLATHVLLDRYVLYESARVVHERKGSSKR